MLRRRLKLRWNGVSCAAWGDVSVARRREIVDAQCKTTHAFFDNGISFSEAADQKGKSSFLTLLPELGDSSLFANDGVDWLMRKVLAVVPSDESQRIISRPGELINLSIKSASQECPVRDMTHPSCPEPLRQFVASMVTLTRLAMLLHAAEGLMLVVEREAAQKK
eukprot:Hpha_TRINITY_DN5079_c0_g1::TRINITY_DN5079_c0_g1_i2::g.94130::m.94130